MISPTRELAMQSFGVVRELLAHHKLTYGLLIGGSRHYFDFVLVIYLDLLSYLLN